MRSSDSEFYLMYRDRIQCNGETKSERPHLPQSISCEHQPQPRIHRREFSVKMCLLYLIGLAFIMIQLYEQEVIII